MEVRVGDLGYEWIEGWARFEDSDAKRAAWTHHGLAALPDDQLVTFHPADENLAFLSQDGVLQRSVSAPVSDAHGISVAMEDGAPVIWLADASMKQSPEADYGPPGHTEWSVVV